MEFAIQVGGGQVRREQTGIQAIVEEVRLAESLGFDAAYVPDHYIFEQTRKLAEQIGSVFGLAGADFVRHPVVLAGTPEEMIEEIRRRAGVHGLALMTVNFSSTEQIREFGEKVVARLRP